MSIIPKNPPCITTYYNCDTLIPGEESGRQGVKIWTGRCSGFLVQSWPHCEQVLEIIDTKTRNTMAIIPEPGKSISFGEVKSVELRTTYRIALMVSWRTVLIAAIDPFYAIISQGIHGHAQWLPGKRAYRLEPQETVEHFWHAWADGILRIAASAGTWSVVLESSCNRVLVNYIVPAQNLTDQYEEDILSACVTTGRYYRFEITNQAAGVHNVSYDLAIVDNPIVQA